MPLSKVWFILAAMIVATNANPLIIAYFFILFFLNLILFIF